jgi:hypothetical protein
MNHIPTNNIKIASALCAIGIPLRKTDPVTWVRQEKNGKPHDQYTFWFDAPRAEVEGLLNASYEFLNNWKYTLPEKHPLYLVLAALYNREILLKLMRDSTPFVQVEKGGKTLLMPVNASPYLKKEMNKHI